MCTLRQPTQSTHHPLPARYRVRSSQINSRQGASQAALGIVSLVVGIVDENVTHLAHPVHSSDQQEL